MIHVTTKDRCESINKDIQSSIESRITVKDLALIVRDYADLSVQSVDLYLMICLLEYRTLTNLI